MLPKASPKRRLLKLFIRKLGLRTRLEKKLRRNKKMEPRKGKKMQAGGSMCF